MRPEYGRAAARCRVAECSLATASPRCSRIGVAVIILLSSAVLLAAPDAFAQVIIQDTFSGPSGNSVIGQSPNAANLPGGVWQQGSFFESANYAGNNQLAISGTQTPVEIATSSGSFTPTTLLTLSAGLETGTGDNDNGDPAAFRGVGLGYFSAVAPNQADVFGYFSGVDINFQGNVQLFFAGVPGQGGSIPVSVAWPTGALGSFSQTKMYGLSYNVNTVTGQISGVSVSSGSVTDTADFAPIDNYNTTGVFTASKTAYTGLVQCSATTDGTAYASDFLLSATASPGIEWNGNGIVGPGSWADSHNWTGGVVPGKIADADAAATSTDAVLFDSYKPTNSAPVVDAGRNVKYITFDNSGGNLTGSITLGTTTGSALLLSSGGTIMTSGSVSVPQNVNAPLVLEGGGMYAFQSGAASNTATLNFGGSIVAGSGSTATLALTGSNTGANTISGPIGNGNGSLSVSVFGANWVLTAANTYTGPTLVTAGTLQIGSGGSLNPASAIRVSGGTFNIASGGSLGASSALVTSGLFSISSGATVGNVAITVNGGTFAPLPGAGALSIGSSGGGSAGATLSLGPGSAFSMVDGAIGTFNLQQGSGFGGVNTALTLGGGTLGFELSSSGADRLAVNVGAASVFGANTVAITPIGSSLNVGTYPLITAPSGLNQGGGNIQFAPSANATYVVVGTNEYQLTLNNSATAETVSVAHANFASIIQDTFSGANGASIVGAAPDTTNLPGGAWFKQNSESQTNVTYKSPNQISIQAINGGVAIATRGAAYTPPTTLTVSAGLAVNNININGDSFSRGLGLGYFATMIPAGTAAIASGFRGLSLDIPGDQGAGAGSVELDTYGGPGVENRLVVVPFPAALGTFSNSTFYTLTYTVDTLTGQISNASLSNGTVTDTADYAAIDNYNTRGVFTLANTAYVGIINSSGTISTGFARNFVLSGAVASTSIADNSNSPTTFGPAVTQIVGPTGGFAGVSTSVTGTTGSGGANVEHSTATILAGMNSTGGSVTVSMAWRTRDLNEVKPSQGPGDSGNPTSPPLASGGLTLVSDVLNLSFAGETNPTDPYVLQITYGTSTFGGGIAEQSALLANGALYLGWLDPNGNGPGVPGWDNATIGNTANNATLAERGFPGSFAAFEAINGANLSNFIGAWGVDTSDNNAWAVLNHASQFAVVPEPSALLLLAIGTIGLGCWRSRWRRVRAEVSHANLRLHRSDSRAAADVRQFIDNRG